jgi:nucleoside-diphosphate-sugar epimerase
MSNPRVLITGATGFLGGALARRLVSEGWTAAGMGRNRKLGSDLEFNGVPFLQGDLSDRSTILHVIQDYDVVVHIAGMSTPWGKRKDFHRANVEATSHIVETCIAHQKHLVHVSSTSVYFDFRERLNIRESDPLVISPSCEYAASKIAAEQVVEAGNKRGLSSVILRPRGIFGPGDTAILPRLLRLLEAGHLRIVGDPQAVTELTYVDNVVEALILCIQPPENALGKCFHVTNGEPVKTWELVADIAKRLNLPPPSSRVSEGVALTFARGVEFLWRLLALKSEPPVTAYSLGLLTTSLTFDLTEARNILGYSPQISMKEGLDRTLEWWRTQ